MEHCMSCGICADFPPIYTEGTLNPTSELYVVSAGIHPLEDIVSETNLRDKVTMDFKSGYNCAESVSMGLIEVLGIDCDVIPRIATGFGAGIGRQSEICGALTGAVIVISLMHGRESGADVQAKETTYALIRQLFGAFKDQFGSILCKDVCGYDLSTPEGVEQFVAKNIHNTICPRFVVFAAEEALRLLNE